MKERQTKKLPLLPIAIGVCALVLILVLVLVIRSGSTDDTSDEIHAGMEYLESLESKDPETVRQVRKDIYQKHLDEKREQLRQQLTDGTLDPFTMFKDYVVMGDSRAVGFWYHDFLDQDRVLADGGHTIRNIPRQMDQLVALNPSTIYLCYGLNDTSIGYWDTAEEYVTEFMQVVDQIKENLPEATVVVSSILPARDPAFRRSSRWYDIPEWSAALEVACAEKGIPFANNDQLAEDYPNYWDPDGIHFRPALYPHWAANLVYAALSEELV